MKIQEFRDKMKQCKKEDVEKIAAELYKLLPKSQKEDDADPLIEDIISGKALAKTSDKKKSAVIDFAELKKLINFWNMWIMDTIMNPTVSYQKQSAQNGGLKSRISSR